MKMKKVCIIMGGVFPIPDVRGGAVERLVTGYMNFYSPEKYELTICSVYDSQAVKAAEKYKDIRFVWTHTRRVDRLAEHAVFMAIRAVTGKGIRQLQRHYNDLMELMQQEQFDLVIAEGGDYQAVLDICKGYPREKMAVHIHHHLKPSQRVARGYGHIIGVSDFVVKEYLKCASEPGQIAAHVVRNGIDQSRWKEASEKEKMQLRKALGIRSDDFVILYVGRLIPEKGVLELIKAVSMIGNDRIKLLIVGSVNFDKWQPSAYLREIKKIAKSQKDRFIFAGFVPNQNLFQYANIAQLWCVPSICEEACGLTALEAMTAGVPLIISRSGGMTEFAAEETALIVEKNPVMTFPERLKSAIESLYQNPHMCREYQRKAEERAKLFGENSFCTCFEEEICKILEVKYES